MFSINWKGDNEKISVKKYCEQDGSRQRSV